jgi:hypothetical protein
VTVIDFAQQRGRKHTPAAASPYIRRQPGDEGLSSVESSSSLPSDSFARSADTNATALLNGDWLYSYAALGREPISAEEILLKERKRISTPGITSFQFVPLGANERYSGAILFPFEGSLFYGRIEEVRSFFHD